MALKTDKLYPIVNGGDNYILNIAASATTSDFVTCGNFQVGGLLIPSNFTQSSIQFNVKQSDTGVVYRLSNPDGSGNPYALLAVPGQHLPLNPAVFSFCPQLQIVCTNAQNNAVQIPLVLGPVLISYP